MTSYGELVKAAIAAVHALRSYQHGNSAPDLAEEIADALQRAIDKALDERETDLTQKMQSTLKIQDLLSHCKDGHCTGSPEQIATMITTLEWVLGKASALR